MRWTRGTSRRNIDDLRGGGGGMFGGGGMRIGCGGFVVLLVLSLLFGQDFFSLLGGAPGGAPAGTEGPVRETPREADRADFAAAVLNSTQETWARLLPSMGAPYQEARMVLFRGGVRSGCGTAQSAMGPFYCPADGRVYIDLGFFDELDQRFGAPGDFAQAYVIAHEIGHHVQNLLGTAGEVTRLQRARPDVANALSVRLELQADCYAGVWAYAARDSLQAGDMEEGMGAAAAVGDDRMQRSAGVGVNAESFTHGSSAQRVAWFRRGFDGGRPQNCDTFRQQVP